MVMIEQLEFDFLSTDNIFEITETYAQLNVAITTGHLPDDPRAYIEMSSDQQNWHTLTILHGQADPHTTTNAIIEVPLGAHHVRAKLETKTPFSSMQCRLMQR